MHTLEMQWKPLIYWSIPFAALGAILIAVSVHFQPITNAGKFFLPGVFWVGWAYGMHALKSKRELVRDAPGANDMLLFFGIALMSGLIFGLLAKLLGATWGS